MLFRSRGYELPTVQQEADAPVDAPPPPQELAEFVTFEAETNDDETAALAAMAGNDYEEVEVDIDFE